MIYSFSYVGVLHAILYLSRTLRSSSRIPTIARLCFSIAALIVFFALCVVVLYPSQGDTQERLHKKLLEFGWDVPCPEYVKENIREMEKRPFDGILFRTKEYNHAFDTRPWNVSDLQPLMNTLSEIHWEKFTDNFLVLYSADRWKMNWFDDNQWDVISGNMMLVSQMGKAGKCVGICFDNEPYGDDPWVYKDRFPGKSYDEVAQKVRQRGAQFMTALQTHMPEVKVLHFFQLGYYGDTRNETRTYRKEKRWDLHNEPDPVVRNQKLSERWLSLFYPFFLGMLEAAGPKVVLIDGNEFAYYNDRPEDYYRNYHAIKQSALTLIPENLRMKYITQTQAGMAVYFDIVMSDSWGNSRSIYVPGNFLTPPERLKFLEHNVYYALTTTDEYVWFYSEKMNWWKDYPPGTSVDKQAPGSAAGRPEGLEDAVRSARQKNEKGLPLGYDISDMITKAWEKVFKKEQELNIKRNSN